MARRRYLGLPLVAIALVLSSCGDDSSDGGGTPAIKQVEVTAADLSFDTASISAEPGESVELTLTNSDDTEHSFTIDDVIDVETEGGEEASDTFTATEGTYKFYCRYHPDQMNGELTVGDSSSDTGGGTDTSSGSAGGMDY
jgi:plastocyanin